MTDTVCAIGCAVDFQCLREHLPTSPLSLSEVKRIHTTATTVRRFRENRQQVWDPKLVKLVVVLLALQTPNIFFLSGPSNEQLRPTILNLRAKKCTSAAISTSFS